MSQAKAEAFHHLSSKTPLWILKVKLTHHILSSGFQVSASPSKQLSKRHCCWRFIKWPCVCVCVCFQSCLTFCNPKDYSPTRLLCPRNFPDKNTGVGCHFLLQGFFLTQGWNPHLLNPLHWQVDSLPLNHQGNPLIWIFLSQGIWDVYVATYFASTFRRAEK